MYMCTSYAPIYELTCLCFYCKRSTRILISVPSGKHRYLAVQVSQASSHCYDSISCRAETSSEGP